MCETELLERLMREYGDGLLRLCFLYLKDYHLAEDVVQETFLKAARSYGTLQNPAAEKAWLNRIAVNGCKNVMRTRWFRWNRYGLASEERAIDEQNPERLLERQTISAALAALSKSDREVLLLHYYQGFSVRETAAVLGKNEGAVAQRLRRARKRLKKKLEEIGYEE